MSLKYRPYLEVNNCVDEYADGDTRGLFLKSGYCLVGVTIKPPHSRTPETREGEARGVVLFNRGVGVWRDPNSELPWSGFGGGE